MGRRFKGFVGALVVGGFVLGVGLVAVASGPCPTPQAPVAVVTDGTEGSAGNPFLITSVAEMQHLLLNLDGSLGTHYVLTQDLNFEVGGGASVRCELGRNPNERFFSGTFDGGGFTIAGFDVSGHSGVGLFPRVNEAEIRNLTIANARVSATGGLAGALAGDVRNTTLTNITVRNSIIAAQGPTSTASVGGIAGQALNYQSSATLSGLRVLNSTVIADSFFGGLFGQVATYPLISEAAVLGTLLTTTGAHGPGDAAEAVGGLIGRSTWDFALEKASFQGAIVLRQEGLNSAGMLIGDASNRASTITDSSARGVLTAGAGTPAGAFGGGGGNLTVTRTIVQARFEMTDSSDVSLNAEPFYPGFGWINNSFHDNEVQSDWTFVFAPLAKTSAELADMATYHAVAGWNMTTDAAAVLAGTASETWLMSGAPGDVVENGFPVHAWLYNGVNPGALSDCQPGFYRPAAIGLSLGCLPAEPGRFVALAGATESIACEPGSYQSGYAATACVAAPAGSFVPSAGMIRAELCAAGFDSSPGASTCFRVVNNVYVPPAPPVLAAPEPVSAPELRVSTRNLGDGTVKVYARDVVGVGKVQFFVNGREVAWVRAADASDPKLNLRRPVGLGDAPSTEAHGLVRTVPLVAGKNVFEIYVSGERVLRRVASGG